MKTTAKANMKEMTMDIIKIIGVALLTASMAGCVNNDINSRNQYNGSAPPPDYDVPAQVVYRIDDHRYISLENYDKCYGDNYYVDTKAKLRTKLWRGNLSRYKGRLSIDDPTGMNIVIPDAPAETCGDKGCNVYLAYSSDGGRTFKSKKYMQSPYPTKASENYSILVAQDGFYVVKTSEYAKGKFDNDVTKYPLAPGIEYDTVAGLPKGYHIEYLSNKPLPPLRTPSGQDRFTCDASIRPSNLPIAK
ncbi:hypothetical protein [Herbaspirillum sp. RV1423]|uniref:T6SS immunity protein Tli3 family protein n=1 Tax=Herbaspirillum sp. RV1423 TaxID=1443993 RepID=UPI0004B6F4B9|nr:hypothetical protein [Herbaspirillum sp. RV1423]